MWNGISTVSRSKDRAPRLEGGLTGRQRLLEGSEELNKARNRKLSLVEAETSTRNGCRMLKDVVITRTPPGIRLCLQHCLLWHGIFAFHTSCLLTQICKFALLRHAMDLGPIARTSCIISRFWKGRMPSGSRRMNPGWLYRCLLDSL